MSQSAVPQITFARESERETIAGEPGETLYQIVERHWHALRGAVLRRFLGNRIDLCDADLAGADLYSADLTCARMQRARLSGACLYGAALTGCDLQDADLSGCDLYRADLRHADLRGANLAGANLERASLAEADLRDAVYDARTRFPRHFEPAAEGMCREGKAGEGSEDGFQDGNGVTLRLAA